jgi:cob(I)alamin adenosyltransferase
MATLDEDDKIIVDTTLKHFNSIIEEALEKTNDDKQRAMFRTLEWMLFTAMHLFFKSWESEPLFATEIAIKLLNENIGEINHKNEKNKMENAIVNATNLN